MTIQFFLVLTGSLLVCSITLAAIANYLAEGFVIRNKKQFVYGFISAIVISFASFLATYLLMNPFKLFWLMGSVFLLSGVVHMMFIQNRYFYAYKYNSHKVLIAEILLGLAVVFFTIVIFSLLQYFLKDKDFLFYPVLLSTVMFFVPLLVFYSFQAAYNIPAAMFPTWKYPSHKHIELPEENPNEKILVIGFEFAEKAQSQRKKRKIYANAPEAMKLGDLFYHFINHYNDQYSEAPIEFANHKHEAYEWWFLRKPKWYELQKILNPELSITENRIQEHTVIICERISNAVHFSYTLQ